MESDIFVPSYIVGKTLPHIVLRFVLSLNSELSFLSLDHLKLSDCDVNVFGVKVSSYCNILERMILSQSKEALKQSLPLSSYRAMRQIERAIFRRFGNEIYIPLYIDDQRPVESFLLTADNVINVGKKLSDDITQLVNQMSEVENTFLHFYWSERSACAALGCWHKRRWPLSRAFFLLSFFFQLIANSHRRGCRRILHGLLSNKKY